MCFLQPWPDQADLSGVDPVSHPIATGTRSRPRPSLLVRPHYKDKVYKVNTQAQICYFVPQYGHTHTHTHCKSEIFPLCSKCVVSVYTFLLQNSGKEFMSWYELIFENSNVYIKYFCPMWNAACPTSSPSMCLQPSRQKLITTSPCSTNMLLFQQTKIRGSYAAH